MSTHATITLEAGENQLHLFRHYDGFPASCEADIATKALKEARIRCPFFDESCLPRRSLVTEVYEAMPHRDTRPVDEITAGPCLASEHHYRVVMGEKIAIHHAVRPIGGETGAETVYAVPEFVEFVNAEIAAMNKRIWTRSRERGANYELVEPVGDWPEYHAIEIHPVHHVTPETVETCSTGEAEVWSAYVHRKAGSVECPSGYGTEAGAIEAAQALSARHGYPVL